MDASKNIWDMIAAATSGILETNKLQINELSCSLNPKSSETMEFSPEVVEYSPSEGQNIINMVNNSKLYEPQICIESGDYITIVYKKHVSSRYQNKLAADANNTIATFCGYESSESELDNETHKLNNESQLDFYDTEEEEANELYITAVGDETIQNLNCLKNPNIKNSSQMSRHEDVPEEIWDSTSNSALCGCHEGSHSRTKCLNTVKYDISLEEDGAMPVDFNQFCEDLHPNKGNFVDKKEGSFRPKEKLNTSTSNRRNKRYLDLSFKKPHISLNDSFPETIFPSRKKRFTMTSTPARNFKKGLEFKSSKCSFNTSEKNAERYEVEE